MHTEATMGRIRTSVLAVLFASAMWLPVSAQEHVVDQATLDQVVADHVRQKADDREAIRRVLELEQVRKVAAGAGLDLRRAETAVAALDDSELALILAAQSGDEVASATLVTKYRAFVRCKARSYFHAGADRDDVVQEGIPFRDAYRKVGARQRKKQEPREPG